MNLKAFGSSLLVLLWSVLLSGCIFSSESQQVRETTEQFWQAVLAKDMETTKDLVTWESAQYLGFLSDNSVSAQRFETGEIKIQDNIAEVATVLYGGEKGDMIIPVRTVLVRHQESWLVDVQKTMGSMVSGAMNAVVEQLNTFMQNGLQDLDRALSENLNQLNQSLKQGMEQLQEELTVPSPTVPTTPASPPPGQAI